MKSFSWFPGLFGFEEVHRSKFVLADFQRRFELLSNGQGLRSLSNNRVFQCGTFSTPSVASLRSRVLNKLAASRVTIDLSLHHPIVGDALILHASFPSASFQAASQFNCLEFPSFHTIPEDGITSYSTDLTQGPACALACPAGTVFRNYFVPVLDPVDNRVLQIGQSKDKQINNLDLIELAINNKENNFINVLNGYTFSPSVEKLASLNDMLRTTHAHNNYRDLVDLVKIGWQQDTEVSYKSRFLEVTGEKVLCSQMYCSALSVAYSGMGQGLWEPLAKIVLQGAYEATLYAAILHLLNHADDATANHSNTVFLTFLGGGVFGNDMLWIIEAIASALYEVQQQVDAVSATVDGVVERKELKVNVCHYRNQNRYVVEGLEAVESLLKKRGETL